MRMTVGSRPLASQSERSENFKGRTLSNRPRRDGPYGLHRRNHRCMVTAVTLVAGKTPAANQGENSMTSVVRNSRRGAVALLLVALLIAAACSSSKTTTTGNTTGTGGGDSADQLAKAQAATELAFKGTNRDVESTPRAAVKGKHIVVISA